MRVPRYAIVEDNSYIHMTWRCHNHKYKNEWYLRDPFVKRKYGEIINKYSKKYNIKLFGITYMSNHVHLLCYCEKENLSLMMRDAHSVFGLW